MLVNVARSQNDLQQAKPWENWRGIIRAVWLRFTGRFMVADPTADSEVISGQFIQPRWTAYVSPGAWTTKLKQHQTSAVAGGRSQESLDIIAAMYAIAKEMQPITGRGIGYKLFAVYKLIPDMSTKSMAKVYRLLKEARIEGTIPWEWIVDETRGLERIGLWDDPDDYVNTVACGYRRDFWLHQPKRAQVWSEKGTVRGVLKPVLDEYGVGFRAFHGFDSATEAHDICEDVQRDGRPLIAFYVGDYDPSGMCMTETDLPKRLEEFGGASLIQLRRLALTREQCTGLPSFPASDKGPSAKGRGDTRYRWFVDNYGRECWELDALDPRELRRLVEDAIKGEIESTAWERCKVVEQAELESLRTVLDGWKGAPTAPAEQATAAEQPAAVAPGGWWSPLV
jgi:hypothetical protein